MTIKYLILIKVTTANESSKKTKRNPEKKIEGLKSRWRKTTETRSDMKKGKTEAEAGSCSKRSMLL